MNRIAGGGREPRRSNAVRALPFWGAMWLGACVHTAPIGPSPSPEAGCERFYGELDEAIDRAGARDAGGQRVADAPYLRADRFLASFADEALAPAALADWLERLRAQDAAARRVEIAHLGLTASSRAVASPFPGLDPNAVVAECGRRLLARDLEAPGRVGRIRAGTTVPDAYRGWQRVLGLYPLTRFALEQAVASSHRRSRQSFPYPLTATRPQGQWLRYAPPGTGALPPRALATVLDRAAQNPLAIPEPRGDERRQLFETFAPIWEIDTLSSADRFGTIGWQQRGRATVRVDSPAVYRFVTYTRFHGAALLQLNYLIWFSHHPARHWLDLAAGELDGLIWRVTLTPAGVPLAYDSIHPCGRSHRLFPGLGYRVQQPETGIAPVLSPMPLLSPRPGQRLVVRISPREHELQAVYPDADENGAQRYAWLEYRGLLALKLPSGARRSLFGPDGVVAGTQRLGRFLLWPSGVVSPGAMRQIGRHAIALTGRRHFDDADLFDTLLRRL